MDASTFAVLAEPTRLGILAQLSQSERAVGELVEELGITQPTVSKHLKVLRDTGFVTCRIDAQRRMYRINTRPFEKMDMWLESYRQMWNKHLDALERHLDSLDTNDET